MLKNKVTKNLESFDMLEAQENDVDSYFTQTVNYIYEHPFEFATKAVVASATIFTGAYMIPLEVSIPNLINNDYIKSIIEYISKIELSPPPDEREFNYKDYEGVWDV